MLTTSSEDVLDARARSPTPLFGPSPKRLNINFETLGPFITGQLSLPPLPPVQDPDSDIEVIDADCEKIDSDIEIIEIKAGNGLKSTKRKRNGAGSRKQVKRVKVAPKHKPSLTKKTTTTATAQKHAFLANTPLKPDVTHPLLHHTFEIGYSAGNDEEEDEDNIFAQDKQALVEEEIQFINCLLTKMSDQNAPSSSSEDVLDIGKVDLQRDSLNARVAIFPGREDQGKSFSDQPLPKEYALLLLPPLSDPTFKPRDRDFSAGGFTDVLSCILDMRSAGRVDIGASLAIRLIDLETATNAGLLPFRVVIQLTISLISPTSFEDHSVDITSKINEVQRRLMTHVFKDQFEYPANHNADIPFLYSSLRPAPPISEHLSKLIQPSDLLPQLLPFQRRTVAWMLEKEGMKIDYDGNVVKMDKMDQRGENGEHNLPLFWTKIPAPLSEQSGAWYLNVLSGSISSQAPKEETPLGGLLAEEPGLGKTIESIALIILNTPSVRELGEPFWNARAELQVYPVKGTLIVTPPSLCPQWAEELARHAPHLKVLQYTGWTRFKMPLVASEESISNSNTSTGGLKQKNKGKGRKVKDVEEEEEEEYNDWVSYAGSFDVVLTTYSTLQSDLNVARPPVKRPRREAAIYQSEVSKRRSPLIAVEWQRVLMDEVQLVGGGKAAEMVSFIPRHASWAVSGTPAKANIHDLIFTLRFLGVEPVLHTPKHWNRLLRPAFCHALVELCERYAVRTLKAQAEGLNIPKQTRYVVPIELGMIERHFYDQALESALHQLGVNAMGTPIYDDWELDVAGLRSWLRKLRQACIHPQVGALGNQGQGGNRILGGAIRPIGDVLAMMMEQNWQTLMTEKKTLVNTRIAIALLTQRTQEPGRYKKSLELLIAVRKDAVALLDEIKGLLVKHDERGKALIEAVRQKKQSEGSNEPSATISSKGKGKQREQSPGLDEDLHSDSEDSEADSDSGVSLPANAEGEDHRARRQALKARIRELRVVLHKIDFSLGDLYHTLGKVKEEEDSYAAAENQRRSLLKVTEVAANRAMIKLTEEVLEKGVQAEELEIPYTDAPGIKTERLFEEADDIIDILNEQRELLWEWRGHIFKLLTEKIRSDGEDGADGNEYQRALDTQVEVESFLKEYAALIADRKEVLNQERTALAAHDDREKKLRHTRAAAKAAAALDEDVEMLEHIEDVAPDVEQSKQLAEKRKNCRLTHNSKRALKSVMIEISGIHAQVVRTEEAQIAKNESLRLRRVIATQTALMDRLAAEQAPFRAAFNGRIKYFRQLQELSDSVAEIVLEQPLPDALQTMRADTQDLGVSIARRAGRQRFLDYMQKSQDEVADEESRECGICCCEFEKGVLLECAHIYCTGCFNAWRKKGEGMGKRCPTCRTEINAAAVYRIMYARAKDTPARERVEDSQTSVTLSKMVVQYNEIPSEDLEALAKVESFGQYGAKIQTLVRHLLLIEERDPGSKSIVFSAWADSLHIIEHALRANGITCIRIDKTGAKNGAHEFRTNPAIRVILLHGERENSGLNLTVAKRVFLVEPTSSNSFEIQAIARVDRMGQNNETEVYCYYATDTVEENILNIGAKNGTSLYTSENATTAIDLAATNLGKQVVDAPNRDKNVLKGDFVASAETMFEILFPHLFEEADVVMTRADADSSQPRRSARHRATSPTAGPSGSQ